LVIDELEGLIILYSHGFPPEAGRRFRDNNNEITLRFNGERFVHFAPTRFAIR